MVVGTREREGNLGPSVATPGSDAAGEVPAIAAPPLWTTQCMNCGGALGGDYCSACGQRALPPDPTIRELAGDAFSEFSGWDGKFVRSLKLLVLHPGELTRKFLIGQRISFISPLRLYLTCSFVFFALNAAAPRPPVVIKPAQVSETTPAGATRKQALSPRMAALVEALNVGLNNLDPVKRAQAEQQLARAPGFLRPVFRAIAIDKKGFQTRMLDAMPRAFFMLIPAIAFALALFYRRRHYPEHIYFAMHYQAFVFLILALNPLVRFTRLAPLVDIVQLLTVVGVIVYEIVALRRVYGGSVGRTIAKAAGMAAICMVTMMATMLVLVYWSSRAYFGA